MVWVYDVGNKSAHRTRADGSVECRMVVDIPAIELLNALPSTPNDAGDKAIVIAQARELREKILNRLTGIQLNTTNPAYITAMQTARQALLDFPMNAAVVAAVTGADTKTAIMAIWYQTGTALATAAPPAATAFTGMGL